jgi:hypothetical protein
VVSLPIEDDLEAPGIELAFEFVFDGFGFSSETLGGCHRRSDRLGPPRVFGRCPPLGLLSSWASQARQREWGWTPMMDSCAPRERSTRISGTHTMSRLPHVAQWGLVSRSQLRSQEVRVIRIESPLAVPVRCSSVPHAGQVIARTPGRSASPGAGCGAPKRPSRAGTSLARPPSSTPQDSPAPARLVEPPGSHAPASREHPPIWRRCAPPERRTVRSVRGCRLWRVIPRCDRLREEQQEET